MKDKTVLLLKAAEDLSSDPYFEMLQKDGITTKIIPTLKFIFINEEILENCLLSPEKFCGIIFTSPRTVEAVHRISDRKEFDILKWRTKKNFAVGEATSKLAASLLKLDLLGEDAGSGEELCKVILSSDYEKFPEPFLLPCSDKSKDTVPKILKENGQEVEKVVCYKTECNPHLEQGLEKLIAEKPPDIIVFFSPSGVDFSNKILKKCYLGNTKQPQCIAIGPTTEKAIKNAEMNLCIVAEKPNPESVLEAVKSLLK